MQRFYLAVLSVIAVSVISWQAAYAGQLKEEKVEGDALQEQAEEILKSESGAKKVTVRVDVKPKALPYSNTVNLASFDLNNDGVLTRDEIGEKLFRIFDRDGNLLIDNIEMETPSLVLLSPMVKTKTVTIDYFSEKKPTQKVVTYEDFIRRSGLSRFDKAQDGLSPRDFLQMSFKEVNVKNDIAIDIYEWKRAYVRSLQRPLHMENYRYNN